MTRKRFEKLLRAGLTRCHEINRAAGEPIGYRAGSAISGRCYHRPAGKSYEEIWAMIGSVLPAHVGK